MARYPASPSTPAPGCRNCGSRRELQVYDAREIDAPYARESRLPLCGRCLRDRGAAWRYRWRIAGRTLDTSTHA